MRVNRETGEIVFDLSGKDVTLKVSWKAISEVQSILGYGIVPLAVRIRTMQFGITELATVIHQGILAADPPVKPEYGAVAERVFSAGLLSPEVTGAVAMFCELALTGGKSVDPEEKGGASGSRSAGERTEKSPS